MPTVLLSGYKFRFYSSDRFEPPHMHIIKAEKEAKIWLKPIRCEYNHGYNSHELNQILKLTQQNHKQLMEVWNDYFGQK